MKNISVHGLRFNSLTKIPEALLGMYSIMCEDYGIIKFSVMEGQVRIWSIQKSPLDVNGHMLLPNPHTIYAAYLKLKENA